MAQVSFRDGVDHRFAKLDPLAVLGMPPTALLTVSASGATALAGLGISTVLDLAASPTFGFCSLLASAALAGEAGPFLGRVPAEFIDPGAPSALEDFLDSDASVLRVISTQLAADMASTLLIRSAGDLGRYPPFHVARAVLAAATGSTLADAEPGSELVPRLGEFPTERHYYTTLVIDQVSTTATTDLATAGAIDLSPTVSATFGFSAPAIGARLTFAQSWFAQGLTLGNLLHSVALAPGESTRIAVLDWSRRTSASGTESISESERLTNNATHNRAVSEVQDAVATEVQSGFSHTDSKSTTAQGGAGLGVSLGPVSFGASGSAASNSTSANSFSTSFGTRNLAASMNQRVMDSTQQSASSARNRRASVVKEVSETEHEQVSTRILANYNHMHAMTVQYFEVIELYRVASQLHQVERCLFVPMKLVTFDRAMVLRYQGVLRRAALDASVSGLLNSEFSMVRVSPVAKVSRFGSIFDGATVLNTAVAGRALAAITTNPTTPATSATATPSTTATETPPTPPSSVPALAAGKLLAWDGDELSRLAGLTGRPVFLAGAADPLLPEDAELTGLSLSVTSSASATSTVSALTVLLRSGTRVAATDAGQGQWSLPAPIGVDDIAEVLMSTGATAFSGKVALQLSYRAARFPVSVPAEVAANASATKVMGFANSDVSPQLLAHLNENRLHYSQAIFRSLDPSSIALLLSGFTWKGQPVADQVDPNPIGLAGNYLVLRMPGFLVGVGIADRTPRAGDRDLLAHQEWKQWLDDRGLTVGSAEGVEQLVPIPTGGVFAEAVLGRSNAAEKLDATRFWNWQDSPIPLQPPEIAAIQMGSRAQPIDVTPGQLGQPVLNIVNPTALPDPAGLGAMVGALQNGSMFRDMSGLAATIALAQSTAGNSSEGAASAGQLANQNLLVAAQKEIEQMRIAAQVAMAAMGMPGGQGGTPSNISEMGAMINSAKAHDAEKGAGKADAAGGESGGGSSGGGGSGGGNNSDGDSGSSFDDTFMDDGSGTGFGASSSGAGSGSLGDHAFGRALFGNLGMPAGDFILASAKRTNARRKSVTSVFVFDRELSETTARRLRNALYSGAQLAGVDDWKELVAGLRKFDRIGTLVFLTHSIRGELLLGGNAPTAAAQRELLASTGVRVTTAVRFEGCSIMQKPISVAKIIADISSSGTTATGHTLFSVTQTMDVDVPRGTTAAAVEAVIAGKKRYLVANQKTAAQMAAKPGKHQLLRRWFRDDLSDDSPPDLAPGELPDRRFLPFDSLTPISIANRADAVTAEARYASTPVTPAEVVTLSNIAALAAEVA